jgi:hypothetical protein
MFNVSLLEVYYLRKGHKPWKYLTREFLDLEKKTKNRNKK